MGKAFVFFNTMKAYKNILVFFYYKAFSFCFYSAFFIRQWKVGKNWFWYTAPLLLIPFSHDAFYVIGLMAYYIPHMSFSFLLLGGWMYLYQEGKHNKGMHIFVMVSAFLACLGGIRQIAMTLLPILMAVCILLFEHSHKIGGLKRFLNKYYYLWTSTLCGLLGSFGIVFLLAVM